MGGAGAEAMGPHVQVASRGLPAAVSSCGWCHQARTAPPAGMALGAPGAFCAVRAHISWGALARHLPPSPQEQGWNCCRPLGGGAAQASPRVALCLGAPS